MASTEGVRLRKGAAAASDDASGASLKAERRNSNFQSSPTALLCSVMLGLLLIGLVMMSASYATTGTLLFEHDLAVQKYFKNIRMRLIGPRKYTLEELAKHDGSNPELPLLLAFHGKVYDVSLGKKHYGQGGSYNKFVGRDATRAYLTGNFKDDLNGNLEGLTDEQLSQLEYWETFYVNHPEYEYVGDLADSVVPEVIKEKYPEKVVESDITEANNDGGLRKYTLEELKKYDGTNPELPLLLAFHGKVYDVSAGKEHYGPGGSYNHFLGKDATRAYLTGNFKDDLNGNLEGLTEQQLSSLDYWEKFYTEHPQYKLVGDLA